MLAILHDDSVRGVAILGRTFLRKRYVDLLVFLHVRECIAVVHVVRIGGRSNFATVDV